MPPSTLIDVSQPGTCRSCKAGVYWREEPSGAKNPYNAPETCPPPCHGGMRVIGYSREDGPTERECERCAGQGRIQISHFATCPNAKEHRRRK